MASIPMNNRTINIEQVYAQVRCPNCKKAYNVQMKSSEFDHNCRCGNCTMRFTVSPKKGSIVVNMKVSVDNQPFKSREILDLEID